MLERYPPTNLIHALKKTGYEDTPGYRAVYEAARSAVMPARRNNAGHWVWEGDDLNEIASALGLLPSVA